MNNKKHKSKCDGEFAMSPKLHLGGVGCPECAVEMNSTGTDESIQVAINCLRKLAEDDRLIIWDPVSKKCLSEANIENICANGASIQISLSRSWQQE